MTLRTGLLLVALAAGARAESPGITFEGTAGPGKGKRVVLVSGDEEYRSEEMLPQLAKILAVRHGFTCTVLFAIDRKDGTINPNQIDNIPGLEALDRADLMVLFTRWRDLPDDQMKHIIDYAESGRPIVAIRTATHAFNLKSSPTYARYTWNSKEWDGGFGRQILGETWINHHGHHGKQSTRGMIAPGAETHPILRGIRTGDIWVPTDVYTVRQPFPPENVPLVLGQVLEGMSPADPPASGPQNSPMMPVAWTRAYRGTAGKDARIFTTTMGSAQDFENEGLRRLLVNACYWAAGLDRRTSGKTDVPLIGAYRASPFGFGGFRKGLKPSDFALR